MSQSPQMAQQESQSGSGPIHPYNLGQAHTGLQSFGSSRTLVRTPRPPTFLPTHLSTRTHSDVFRSTCTESLFPGNSASERPQLCCRAGTRNLPKVTGTSLLLPSPGQPAETVLRTTPPQHILLLPTGTAGAHSFLELVVLRITLISARPPLQERTTCPSMPRSRKGIPPLPGRAGAAPLFVGAWEGRRYGRSQDRGRAGADETLLGPRTRLQSGSDHRAPEWMEEAES